jgi:hypothetical protein
MFKRSLLWSTALIGSLLGGSITSGVAAENVVIPNFASADFGWLLQGGIDFRPIPGKVPPIAFDPAYPQGPGNQRGVMERMSDGGKGLEATVTVDDPGTFNQPAAWDTLLD